MTEDSYQEANNKDLETSFTITDSDLESLQQSGYSKEDIYNCRVQENLPSTYDTTCIRLLASRNHNSQQTNGDSLNRIWYRGIVKVYRKGFKTCDDDASKTCLEYDYDQDFLQSTLMWSQVSIYGPWVHIPHGCPVIADVIIKKEVVEPCTEYHRIGQTIQAAANYARVAFPFNLDADTVEQDTNVTDFMDDSTVQGIFDFTNGATSADQIQDPMAKCLLERLVVIQDTTEVQCLLGGFYTSGSDWTEGLPSGMSEGDINVNDCAHMANYFEHGHVCYQKLLLDKRTDIHSACEDFLTKFKRASLYGECVSKCGEVFKNNFKQFGYNQHLFSNWSTSAQSALEKEDFFMEEHDGDEGMFLDGTSVGAVFKDEMQSRGPGSYPYCVMSLYADWNVCHHADASSDCRSTCTTEYTALVESFEDFKNSVESNYSHTPSGSFAWDNESAAGKFNQIQSYYEATLSTLQVQRNEKDLLEDHLKELKAAKENLESESDENNDPALLAEVTEQYQKTLNYLFDKQALKGSTWPPK